MNKSLFKVSASIVIYNESENTLSKLLESFFSLNLKKELIVLDNSPRNTLKEFCETYPLTYIHVEKNIGFGRGHNIAFQHIKQSDIHLILNPDINFEPQNLQDFLEWFIQEKNLVLAIPKVLYPDESFQYVVRDIPTPFTLLKRKLHYFNDEWSESKLQEITEVPFANGCFFAFKSDVFDKLDGFDEDYFMYMEDIDIWIRAKKYGKTVYNPYYKIYHEHRKGSSKSLKLFIYHLVSAIKFFRKYSL